MGEFEDDSFSEGLDEVKEKVFQSINSNNMPCNKVTFDMDDITSDDEFYTLQCPKSFNKDYLMNNTYKLSSTYNIVNKDKNECFSLSVIKIENQFISVAVPNKLGGGKLLHTPLQGHILITEAIEQPQNILKADYNPETIQFPEKIKIRHPLLGSSWKKEIKLSKASINKAVEQKKLKKVKKEKKSLKHKRNSLSDDSTVRISKKMKI